MFKNKKGFTVIELIIGIAIVAILGGIAYYVSQNKSSADVVSEKGVIKPKIIYFTANPSTIKKGESAKISWKSSGGKYCQMSIVPPYSVGQFVTNSCNGSMIEKLDTTTDYTLLVVNARGYSTSKKITVTVNP